MIGISSAPVPEDKVTSGSLLKLITSEDPYPTPLSIK